MIIFAKRRTSNFDKLVEINTHRAMRNSTSSLKFANSDKYCLLRLNQMDLNQRNIKKEVMSEPDFLLAVYKKNFLTVTAAIIEIIFRLKIYVNPFL